MTPTATATACPRCAGRLFREPPSVFDNAEEWACVNCGHHVYSDPPEDSDPGQRSRNEGLRRTRPRLGGNR